MVLAYGCKVFSNYKVMIIGNIISAVVSVYMLDSLKLIESWDYYFNVLTLNQLCNLLSIINLLLQLLVWKYAKVINKKSSNSEARSSRV